MQITEAKLYRSQVINLLLEASLPVSDLTEALNDFFVVLHKNNVAGVAGLEVYGKYGLLRSLAVHKNMRNKGIAADLIITVETLALKMGLSGLFLLTETAADYLKIRVMCK